MEELLKQGKAFFAEDNITEAEKCFQEVLEKDTENLEALNNLGAIRYSQSRFSEAETLVKEVLKRDNSYCDARRNLSVIYRQTGRLEKAEEEIKICLRHEGDTPELLNELNHIVIQKLKTAKKEESAEIFRGAFSEINITPNVSETNAAALQGMAGPPRLAGGVALPLTMQLFLLEDANYTKILFVSADLLGFSNEMVEHLRAVCGRWGIDPEGVMLSASHTHYAPGTVSHISETVGPFCQNYANQIVPIIDQQLPVLYKNLENCVLFHGGAEAQIGMNRRLSENGNVHFAPNPEGFYDTFSPFLLIRFAGNGRRILLVNHGCHPTGLGQETLLSSDFPGYMRHELLTSSAVNGVMFFQGALGSVKESVPNSVTPAFCSDSTAAAENGKILAKAMLASLHGELFPVNGTIFCSSKDISLPLKQHSTTQHLEDIKNDSTKDPLIRTWATHLLKNFPSGDFPRNHSIQIQNVSIGDQMSFTAFPAELVAEIAPKLRSVKGATENVFLLSCTNGLAAYLPTDEIIRQGGYEAEVSHTVYLLPAAFDVGTESAILSGVECCFRERLDKDKPNGYGRYHFVSGKKQAFFVLSSGRCGTMTLAGLLNTASNAHVWHHPQPDLISEALAAYHGTIDKKKTFWEARYSILHKTWAEGLIHGETDLLMSPFCDMLANEIPDSKFLILVRDPRDFVRSGMRRNYYEGHGWDFGRLRPQKGTEAFERWNRLDQFDKICWLWRETYERIFKIKQGISGDRVKIVHFEDLVKDSSQTKEVFEFLGLKGFEELKIEELLERKLNAQQTGDFPKSHAWPKELTSNLLQECGGLAKSLGYRLDNLKPKNSASGKKPLTIWDFKKFKHQPYPSSFNSDIFIKKETDKSHIDSNTGITSLGSCFARNIALYLREKGFNYLVTEFPFQEGSAHWDQVFNTSSIRQIFEYTFDSQWSPLVRWWPRGNRVQDPFRRNIIYNKETCDPDFDLHRKASFRALTEAEIIIITLGLIEIWRDKRDKMTFYRVPSARIYNTDTHEFYVQKVDDCLSDLQRVHHLLKDNNPTAKIILTVSPVPLFATFRMDVDVVSANMLSKSTLRVAAETFSEQHENVSYFPSYEIVTQALKDPYEADNRHVTKKAIHEVMKVFEAQFVSGSNISQRVQA